MGLTVLVARRPSKDQVQDAFLMLFFSEDIIRMITLQAEPFFAGGPRPRLSLYLSSQLMYGCVKVYNKQNDYLISTSTQLLQFKINDFIENILFL